MATYINSGNLIFTSPKEGGRAGAGDRLGHPKRFGANIDVAVRTPARLKKILADNPYPDGNPSQVTVAFLMKAAPGRQGRRWPAMATEHEPFTFAGSEVYVHYSNGQGTSKLAEKFSSIIGVSATMRNVTTVDKLLALCGTH